MLFAQSLVNEERSSNDCEGILLLEQKLHAVCVFLSSKKYFFYCLSMQVRREEFS